MVPCQNVAFVDSFNPHQHIVRQGLLSPYSIGKESKVQNGSHQHPKSHS